MSQQPETERIIRRILRVNHAGEHGAISIYSQQASEARKQYDDLSPWISETLDHEIRHRTIFHNLMPARGAKPCRLMFVWQYGGAFLGWITAQLGRNSVLICTAAVEQTVHRHLDDQINYLRLRDPELAAAIEEVQREENAHLSYARQNMRGGILAPLVFGAVTVATELLILISTRGDSFSLTRKLRAAT